MEQSTKQKLSWVLLTLLGFGLLGLLLYTRRDVLDETIDTIRSADWRYLLFLPIFQATSWFFVGKYYQSMFSYFGAKISAARAWAVVAALNFVNQIIPSGGVAGMTYLAYGFRNVVTVGKTGLVQLSRYILSMAVYVIITPIVLLMVYFAGESQWLEETISKALQSPTAWVTAIGFIFVVLFVHFTLNNRKATDRFAKFLQRFVNRIAGIFKKGKKLIKTDAITKTVHEFHDGFDFLKSQRARVIKPFLFMVLSTAFEIAIVYMAFKAVGGDISIGVLLVSFIAANIAGVVSIIPGDVGVHESVMILMLSALGIDDAVAISATLLYRIFNKMIFLPIGFFFYTRMLKPAEAKQKS